MKYIRTKDGIYYVPGLRYQNPEKCECEHGLIIKHADTIEELCDEYVIVPKNKKYKPWTEKTLSVFDDLGYFLKHNDIYLSIWVDALLKPVAKMNEEGELELL